MIEEEEGYGGFALGAMDLALPISALREVVSFEELSPLPYRSPCVLGGMNLRGVVIPVVDLRRIFGGECAPLSSRSVVVMCHGGWVVGLLVERVTGIFRAPASQLRRHAVAPGSMTVVAGSLYRRDIAKRVTVLCESLLAGWPDIPLVEDPDVTSGPSGTTGEAGFAERVLPVMLLRCERVGFALDAVSVHSTLANPPITPPNIAMGACRGSIEYRGQRIAAVDLYAFCGFGNLGLKAHMHAFVVRLDTGYVAFLVDEVMDVARIAPTDVVALASYALPEPGLFSGALPSAGVVPEFTAPADRAKAAVSQYLVLDTAALLASAELSEFARMNLAIEDTSDTAPGVRAPAAGERGGIAGVSNTTKSRTVLTFDLAGEVAVPLEQVAEILPYEIASGVFSMGGALIGLMINRGQSIPLFCLQRLANFPPTAPTAETRVLVVQSGDDYVGFVVPRVRAIVPASWNPLLPAYAAPNIGPYFANSRTLALVGQGQDERMLRVIDLAQAVLGLRPNPSGPACVVTQAPKAARVGSLVSN